MYESWANIGSALASLMFLWAVIRQYFPFNPESLIKKHTRKLFSLVHPYIEIIIPEFTGERMNRSEAYSTIQSYLSASCSQSANKLKADFAKDAASLLLTMDDNEEVTDEFKGAKIWWYSRSITPRARSISFYPAQEERRYYQLTFHKTHRDLVVNAYLSHVMAEGKAVGVRNRQRKLYTNNPSSNWYGYKKSVWSHVVFDHPATFDTLAMPPIKKKEIMDDLDTFRKGKDYYAKIGKAWKRGYLLYGPPGTGKSTMIAAMANYLDYDVYDIELTTVKTNSELRKLLIESTGKSIIVLEDIDCSLDLTGNRKKKSKKDDDSESKEKKLQLMEEEKEESSRVTLSGLLNFIDGLWSASAGERLIVFTTNHIEKLDPALIRRGRMDKHIEMSYCSFEAFQVLAKNYMGIDSHNLFERIRGLLKEVNITPADVAENLMPKSVHEDVETCLVNLIQALNAAKEEPLKGVGRNEGEIVEDGESAEKEEPSKGIGTNEGEIMEDGEGPTV